MFKSQLSCRGESRRVTFAIFCGVNVSARASFKTPLWHCWIKIGRRCHLTKASQVALVVKNLPENAGNKRLVFDLCAWGKVPWRKTWQPSILAWRIPWTEEPDGLHPWGRRVSTLNKLSKHACHLNIISSKLAEASCSTLLFLSSHRQIGMNTFICQQELNRLKHYGKVVFPGKLL